MKSKLIIHLFFICVILLLGVRTYHVIFTYDLSSTGLITMIYKGKTIVIKGSNVKTSINNPHYILYDSIQINKEEVVSFYSSSEYYHEVLRNSTRKHRPGSRHLYEDEETDEYYDLYYSRFIEDREVINVDEWVIDKKGKKFSDLFK